MQAQLARLERRFLEIESLLNTAEVSSNANEFRKLSKERSDLQGTVELYRQYKKVDEDLRGAEEVLKESTGEMYDLAREEVVELKEQLEKLEVALHLELLPKDPNDSRDILLELRAGAGGDEASLFVAEVLRMYTRFCERKRWKVELLSMSENEVGGMKEVICSVTGEQVYRLLKYESGVHRVQRVPDTETQGRVHTSTITVAVLPEADEVEVHVEEKDLRIDTYRASGAGGQHVNRTDSAVRITHIPTGVVVACQDERSQIKNRAKAMKILKSRILEAAQIESDKNMSQDRRALVGRGDRSERIRTYNFPQSRVTDHRINHTTHAIDDFMVGEIDEMIQLLQNHYQTEALKLQSEGS